ncbi:hypothetical protein [Flavobacterium poyangense]|uniref:hypothetical protein n=1 Tax=Flavobacterium poyangense TaxID=2204302 RepID=UPI00141E0776|nr:hypothetical protein [Flavobacterium sp. JXAS1]
MDNWFKIKDEKEVILILTKLKSCPSPQGGILIFLLTLLILEDYEKQETLELINAILFQDHFNFSEEWDLYIASFCLLLSRINQMESKKADSFINNLKSVPAFLDNRKGNYFSLEEWQDFINKYGFAVFENEKRDKLKKMLGTTLNDKVNDVSKKLKS